MEKFSVSVMLAKGVKMAVKAGVAWLAAKGLKIGVTVNEAVLVTVILAGMEMARNWLKVKFGDKVTALKWL